MSVGWWGAVSRSVQGFGRAWLEVCEVNCRDGGRVHVLRRRDNKDNRGGGIGVLYAYRRLPYGMKVEFT